MRHLVAALALSLFFGSNRTTHEDHSLARNGHLAKGLSLLEDLEESGAEMKRLEER